MFSSVNTCWTLVGAFLVYFMQAGFALCEAGFTRATNTGNILQFFFHSLHRNMLALHFLKNTAHALNPALHLLNRAVNIILFTFINNVIEFHFQLSHSQFIRAQNASP